MLLNLDEVARALIEKQKEKNRLKFLEEKVKSLERQNEQLTTKCKKVGTDLSDIAEHLQRKIDERDTKIDDLTKTITDMEADIRQMQENHQIEMSKARSSFSDRSSSLQSRLKTLNNELEILKTFKIQKKEIETKLEQLEQSLRETEERARVKEMDLERQLVNKKDMIYRDLKVQIRKKEKEMQEKLQDELHDITKRTMEENSSKSSEIHFLSYRLEELHKANKQLKVQGRRMKSELAIKDEIQKDCASKVNCFKTLIHKLQQHNHKIKTQLNDLQHLRNQQNKKEGNRKEKNGGGSNATTSMKMPNVIYSSDEINDMMKNHVLSTSTRFSSDDSDSTSYTGRNVCIRPMGCVCVICEVCAGELKSRENIYLDCKAVAEGFLIETGDKKLQHQHVTAGGVHRNYEMNSPSNSSKKDIELLRLSTDGMNLFTRACNELDRYLLDRMGPGKAIITSDGGSSRSTNNRNNESYLLSITQYNAYVKLKLNAFREDVNQMKNKIRSSRDHSITLKSTKTFNSRGRKIKVYHSIPFIIIKSV